MGILTNSKKIREQLVQRNLYTADMVYDLNKDLLSKVLNKAQGIGFDLRRSLLINAAERIVDNTPLVRDGAERLAIEFGRRMVDNAVHDALPSVRIENLFSKRGNKTVFALNKDYTITPKEKENSLKQFIKANLGIRTSAEDAYIPESNTDREAHPGGIKFYETLGDGQKWILHENIKRNYFNRFSNGNVVNSGKYSIHASLYSKEFLTERSGSNYAYSSYVLNRSKNATLDTSDFEATSLAETLSTRDVSKDMHKGEGFGDTGVKRGEYDNLTPDEALFMAYTSNKDVAEAMTDKFGVKRGIVYHTQQIALTGTDIGNNIALETTKYGVDENGNYLFKGSSECRSYTMGDGYGVNGDRLATDKLIRWKGNGNPDSVLKDSVIPNIYPKNPNDLRRLMFSIENLAYSAADMPFLPENQRGPNNGRIMWFAPYGLKVGESVAVDWDETSLLGRIEPVYTYNRMTRSAQIQFMLLMDSPPNAKDMNPAQLAKWFSGCEDQGGVAPTFTKPVITKPTVAPQAAPEATRAVYSGNKLTYYFNNNKYTVDSNYEYDNLGMNAAGNGPKDSDNVFGLNKGFASALDELVDHMHVQLVDGYHVSLSIEGHCSSLHTEPYNAVLSFQRSNALMTHIIGYYNSKYGKNISMRESSRNKPISDIKTSDLGVLKYTYESDDKTITVTYGGGGEKGAAKEGENKLNVSNERVKKDRNAKVTSVIYKFVAPTDARFDAIPTRTSSITASQAKSQSAAANSVPKDVKVDFNRFNDGGLFTKGFDKMSYFKAVYHSQTPYDVQQRYTFLHQLTRPRRTLETALNTGTNSLYGKMPVCVLRLGDFWHSKMIIRNVSFDMTDTTWDLNPEGMGVMPMLIGITLDVTLIGGMALEFNVNKLLTANDQNFSANSTYYDDKYHTQNRWDYQQSVRKGKDGKPIDPVYEIWEKMKENAAK